MSGVAMEWAARQDFKGFTQLVLLRLCFHHNHETGRCDPSVGTVAAGAGISDVKARRCIREIERSGLLEKELRKVGKVNASNAYRVRLDLGVQADGVLSSGQGVLSIGQGGTVPQVGGVLSIGQTNKEVEQGREQGKVFQFGDASQGRKKRSPKAVGLPELPAGAAPEKWEAYLSMRRQINKPVSPLRAAGLIADLTDLVAAGHDADKVMEKARRRCWLSFNGGEDTKAETPAPPATEYAVISFEQAFPGLTGTESR